LIKRLEGVSLGQGTMINFLMILNQILETKNAKKLILPKLAQSIFARRRHRMLRSCEHRFFTLWMTLTCVINRLVSWISGLY